MPIVDTTPGPITVECVNGEPVITEASPVGLISLELIREAAPADLRLGVDEITLTSRSGWVTYKVIGWQERALLVSLIEDRREG